MLYLIQIRKDIIQRKVVNKLHEIYNLWGWREVRHTPLMRGLFETFMDLPYYSESEL
jgi:hypothetical protein